MSVVTSAGGTRRAELGAFLRSRRERITPEDVGLPLTFTLVVANAGDPTWPEAITMIEKANAAGGDITAQLLPLHRGILETIYFRAKDVSAADEFIDIYQKRYADEPFVRLYKAGEVPDLAAVQRTNFCDIGVKLDAATGRAVVVTVIDNLVKGAAGQAVQNMNLALGFPETEGLA